MDEVAGCFTVHEIIYDPIHCPDTSLILSATYEKWLAFEKVS
jgi:hypothetical protein